MKIQITKSPGNKIIVEKEEQIVADWDGDGAPEMMGVNTGSHDSGNDQQISVPDSAFVYSDTKKLRIKNPNLLSMFNATKAQTPGKLAKKYPLNDHKSAMENPDTDPMARKTHSMMYTNNMKKLAQLAEVQENMKAAKGIPASPSMMRTGGPSGANMGNRFRFDQPLSAEQQWDMENRPDAVGIANMLYGPSNTGTFTDDQYGPRTQFARQWQSPTPANLQQGLPETGSLGTSTPSPVGSASNEPDNMNSDTGTRGYNRNRLSGLKKVRVEGLGADAIEDLALGMKALNTRKYTPWEPAVQVVKPSLLLESDQPIRNVLSENTNALTNAMYSGNSRAGRSAANAMQGELLRNAVQGAGEVSNRNQQAGNRYSELLANIENTRLMQERERAKKLYDGNVIADQQYRNSLNALGQQYADTARQREERESVRQWADTISPYFNTDKRGRPVFKDDAAQARWLKEMNDTERGSGMSDSKGNTYEDWYKYYTETMKVPADRAQDMAATQIKETTKLPKTKKSSSKKTPTGTERTTTGKYGGLLASRRW